jgi:hypothetical protein
VLGVVVLVFAVRPRTDASGPATGATTGPTTGPTTPSDDAP